MKLSKIQWGAIVGFLGVLTYFGLDISESRPALLFELNALKNEVYADKCESLKKEWYIAKDLAEAYVRKGEAPPQWLYEKIARIERDMDQFCKE